MQYAVLFSEQILSSVTVELNIDRLDYLLALYKMSKEELLSFVNKGLKRLYSIDDIFTENIELKILKRIDALFNKSIYFYIDPTPIGQTPDTSIFFRKTSFNTPLNLEARKIVNKFENLKHTLSSTLKLSDLRLDRKLPCFNLHMDARIAASEMRENVYPPFSQSKREFLKTLISKLAEVNVFVFEFIEYHNQTEKANIDGFYLKPNIIVIKRQKSPSRELFTIAHELGHLLLNQEEIESFDYLELDYQQLNAVEKWCNEFAFYFLVGEYSLDIERITVANANNDYCYNLIETISQNTHISRIAIYTHLLFRHKISSYDYHNVKQELDEQYQRQVIENREQRLIDLENGKRSITTSPKPIVSPLFISSLQAAYYSGAISEFDFGNTLSRILRIKDYAKYL